MQREGDAFIWVFADSGVGIGFNLLRETSDGLLAEVSVQGNREIQPGKRAHYHWAKLNLSSTRSRADLVRALDKRNSEILWDDLIEYSCVKTAELFREGEPLLNLSSLGEPQEEPFLVDKILPDNDTSVVFADGGSGKSYFVLAVGMAVRAGLRLPCGLQPRRSANVLYLDWEANAQEVARRKNRLARGFGIEAPDILYIHQTSPLAENVERFRKEIARHAVGLVIVDSIAPACGGEPENAGTINHFFNALRVLSPAARLVVSHISHAGVSARGQESHPFGSIFVKNLARSVWELRRSENSAKNVLEFGVFHKKVNEGPLLDPLGFQITFGDNAAYLQGLNVAEDDSLASHASLGYRIRAALRRGSLSTSALSEQLTIPEKTLRVTLNRMKDVQKIEDGGGRGNVARWGLTRAEADDDLPF